MKSVLLALWVMFAVMPVQDLPHAFPRSGAKQLIDNERVTVWEVTMEKGKPTPMHRHRYDMIGVDLADATLRVTSEAGRVSAATARIGDVFSLLKGKTESQEGTSDQPRHAIMIDLKDMVVPPLPNKSGYPDAFPREGAKKILENTRVTVWDYTWTPGKPSEMHFHPRDVVVVYLGNGEMSSTTPDGKTVVNTSSFGQVKFNPRDRTHTELLVKGSQRIIAVELK